jgi:glycosyltransferase involved in cell wall biosynthesis
MISSYDAHNKRLLIVTNVFPPQIIGGAEIVAQRQAVAMANLGFSVYVLAGEITSDSVNPPHIYAEIVNDVQVFRIASAPVRFEESHRRIDLADFIKLVFTLTNPDIVHLHNLPGLGAGIAAFAKQTGAMVLMTMHDAWGFCLRQTALRPEAIVCPDTTECDLCHAVTVSDLGERLPIRMRRDYVRWCLEQADLMLFPSNALRDAYVRSGFEATRCRILSNGINLDGFPPRQRTPVQHVSFLCASTLGEHKGVRALWDALETLLLDHDLENRWSITLAGDGPLAAELQARFRRGSLHEPVTWSGFIPRASMATAVDRADVVILGSIWPENEPVTLLEAIASGAAQLGTDIGGIPELIEHERSGLLIHPGDATVLANAMRRLILAPEEVVRFSARNLERRGDFDENRTVDTLADYMVSPINPSSPPRRLTVLCWGEMSDISADAAVSRRLRKLNAQIRLVWHEWVDTESMIDPDVICVFGQILPYGAVGRAILSHKPILIPYDIPIEDNLIDRELTVYYQNEIEALDILDRIIDETTKK